MLDLIFQESKASIEPEHTRKLFIGGLDYSTTADKLEEHFSQFGTVVDVVVMKDPATKRSRGFGFVAFLKSYMVDKAQANRPHEIDGRQVDTKRAVPRDEIEKPNKNGCRKIFVGGIKEEAEEEVCIYSVNIVSISH
jgi:heterogeneous nuclear ribonucleoprotein A1/A3